MTEPELIEKKEKAQAFFLSKWPGLKEHEDDFGHYCVTLWLSGEAHPEKHFFHLSVDYLRAHVKRVNGKGTQDLALSKLMSQFELDEEEAPGIDSQALESFERADWIRSPGMDQKHRIVLILYFDWGFSLDEIGDVMGLKKARVSQIFTEAKQERRERMR